MRALFKWGGDNKVESSEYEMMYFSFKKLLILAFWKPVKLPFRNNKMKSKLNSEKRMLTVKRYKNLYRSHVSILPSIEPFNSDEANFNRFPIFDL